MTARSLRRAAERKSAKVARKQQRQHAAESLSTPPAPNSQLIPGMNAEDSAFMLDFERELAEMAIAEQKAAEQHQSLRQTPEPPLPPQPLRRCTGPTSPEGKAISSLNRLKHGLTGTFRVLEFESQALFDELRDGLRAEHAPATLTETLLVDRMAEHIWLSQRAQRLQDDELLNGNEKTFALYLRYQTTNDRAFYKCLRELATLREERRQFESQSGRNSQEEGSTGLTEFESQPPQIAHYMPRPLSAIAESKVTLPRATPEPGLPADTLNRKTVRGTA